MFHAVTAIFTIMTKDLRLVLARGAGLAQALLLGLLLVFVFSLARQSGEVMTPQAATTIFWLASAFCQVLVFNMLYALEEAGGARCGLLLMPAPVQAVWFGKAGAGLIIMLLAQTVFLPAAFVFLDLRPGEGWLTALAGILLVDMGLVTLGSLLGALSQGQAARESLLSVVLFPLIVPLLLAGIRLCSGGLVHETGEDMSSWLGLVAAFDAIFLGAGLLLFPFVFSGDA